VRSPRAGIIGAHLTSSQRALIELGVYLTNVRCGPSEAMPKSSRLFREIGKPRKATVVAGFEISLRLFRKGHMRRPAFTKNRLLITLCGIGGLLALGIAGPAPALTISVEESIIWQTRSVFPGATFTGSSSFATGTLNIDQHFVQDGSFGAQTYTVFSENPRLRLIA
jgi:hypothetical protein